uniref:Methyltransferase FkbM domain-containing protein n=1 Tax=Noctiluca scintillans TaxID=2966 RepID=A0A7S1FK55_NOCSC|mmetsp:Transcript_8125/g.22461  ORF Transcript_8125/g.22461 Transcript_8125/m.22461 type:complete len:391 (+) Transcript_8125:2-1174(+)
MARSCARFLRDASLVSVGACLHAVLFDVQLFNRKIETVATSLAARFEQTHSGNISSTVCSEEQRDKQDKVVCDHFVGRDNLDEFLAYVRYHVPEASTFLDVGGNKGLFSARIFELWRPEFGISSKGYSRECVTPYFKRTGFPSHNFCGKSNMCREVAPDVLARIRSFAMSPSEVRRDGDLFVVHSFEPQPLLFDMHVEYQGHNGFREVWQWHRLAVSDFHGQVRFPNNTDEGGAIMMDGEEGTVVETVTLDTLAYGHRLFGNRVIDVLKIDAEGFDAQVVAGASRLLFEQRIRVMMWETPNRFPLTLMGEIVTSHEALCDVLDRKALMTCYIPAKHDRMIKLTGCSQVLSVKCSVKRQVQRVSKANVMCVHRTNAEHFARVVEERALVYP